MATAAASDRCRQVGDFSLRFEMTGYGGGCRVCRVCVTRKRGGLRICVIRKLGGLPRLRDQESGAASASA